MTGRTKAKLPETPCPNCGSPQKFFTRYEDLGDNIIEVFSSCNMCRHRIHIRKSTKRAEHIRGRIARVDSASIRRQFSHGKSFVTTERKLAYLRETLDYELELHGLTSEPPY